MDHPLAASALQWGQSLRTPVVPRTFTPPRQQSRGGGAASSSPPSLERCCSLPGGAAATPPGHCCAQGAEQRPPSNSSTRKSAKPCTRGADEDASPWQQNAHARWHHQHTRGQLRTADPRPFRPVQRPHTSLWPPAAPAQGSYGCFDPASVVAPSPQPQPLQGSALHPREARAVDPDHLVAVPLVPIICDDARLFVSQLLPQRPLSPSRALTRSSTATVRTSARVHTRSHDGLRVPRGAALRGNRTSSLDALPTQKAAWGALPPSTKGPPSPSSAPLDERLGGGSPLATLRSCAAPARGGTDPPLGAQQQRRLRRTAAAACQAAACPWCGYEHAQ